MPTPSPNRREWFAASAATTALVCTNAYSDESNSEPTPKLGLCLNTSTIRGQNLSLEEEITIAAEAGYDAIEPWMVELRRYIEMGGSLKDLNKRIQDAGLRVGGAIGFAQWIVDDASERAKGLEQAKQDMDVVRAIGGDRMAAPPAGATKDNQLELTQIAERYAALLKVGDDIGVVPMVEVWGFSINLSRLGESVAVMIESGHPKASLLPDIYHLYKGGSPMNGLSHLRGDAIGLFHINDYPDIPRDAITDADRVFPSDGIAPMKEVMNILRHIGYRGMLSLELFNREYWKRDPKAVAVEGYRKMKSLLTA